MVNSTDEGNKPSERLEVRGLGNGLRAMGNIAVDVTEEMIKKSPALIGMGIRVGDHLMWDENGALLWPDCECVLKDENGLFDVEDETRIIVSPCVPGPC